MKSPLAKAIDKYLSSDKARKSLEGVTQGKYLRNRIELAFIAGWDACVKYMKEKRK